MYDSLHEHSTSYSPGVYTPVNFFFGLWNTEKPIFGLKTVFNWNLFVILEMRSVILCKYGGCIIIPFLSLFSLSLAIIVFFLLSASLKALLFFINECECEEITFFFLYVI